MRTCLLHQKLQILNVCIDRKILHEQNSAALSGQVLDEKNESEDEFYDCDEDEQQNNIDEGDESKFNLFLLFCLPYM